MTVLFTLRAEKKFHSIKQYIIDEFGQTVAEAFSNKVENFLEILVKYPEIGAVEFQGKMIRGFQITKQTKLFYRIKSDKIIVLTLFDVRQDPSKKLR